MPTISVIVPIYNVEQYLCKCLDSILNQTFTDFELLLIDDGSPDKSGQICDEYAQKDSRIRVFHKENGGVSSARNFGLDNAQGKWIAFIDSDDWVDNTYLEHLLKGDEDVELRVMGLMRQNSRMKWKKEIPHKKIFLIDDFWKYYKLYLDSSIIGGPVLKLFLLSILNRINIRFDLSLSYGEDAIFSLRYLQQIKSISVKNYAEYYYRNSESSLSKTIINDRNAIFTKKLEEVTTPLLNTKKLSGIINAYLSMYCIKNLYAHQNLKTKERQECLSQILCKLNNIDFNGFRYLLVVKRKLGRCIICLYYVPIVVADIIFLFLFWVLKGLNLLK
jgi:glycosyltransferase involved in cell wall biosynthesis